MLTGLWESLWRPHIESKTEPKFTNTKNHEHLQFLESILSEYTRKTLTRQLNNVFKKFKGKHYSRIIAGWPSWSEITFLFPALPMTQNYTTQEMSCPSKIVFNFRDCVKPFIKYLKITQRNMIKIFPLKPTSARSFVKLSVNECFWARSNLWLRT